MNRPSRLETLMDIAQIVARRGTCSRLQVGAVIHREGRILSTGYNGSPSGVDHCHHESWVINEKDYLNYDVPAWVEPYAQSTILSVGDPIFSGRTLYLDNGEINLDHGVGCTLAAHAERNAIDWAARYGIALLGSELVTTDTPCSQCAGSIINSGISHVVALRPYRDQTGVKLMRSAGVSMVLAEDVIK